MKLCPYCWEMIQNVAKKCRYCWEWLKDEKEAKVKVLKTNKKINLNEKDKLAGNKWTSLSKNSRITPKSRKVNSNKTYNAINRRDKIIAWLLDCLLAITIIWWFINIYKVFKWKKTLWFCRIGLDYYKDWYEVDIKNLSKRYWLYAPFLAAFIVPIILLCSIIGSKIIFYYFNITIVNIRVLVMILNVIECLRNNSSFLDKLLWIELKKLKESNKKYENIPQEWNKLSEAQKSSLIKKFPIGIGWKILAFFFPWFYFLWTRNYLLFFVYIIWMVVASITSNWTVEMILFLFVFLIVIDLSFNLGRFAYDWESWKMKDYLIENKNLKDEWYAVRCKNFNIWFWIVLLISIIIWGFFLSRLHEQQEKYWWMRKESTIQENSSSLYNSKTELNDSFESRQLWKLIKWKDIYGNKNADVSLIVYCSPDLDACKGLLAQNRSLQEIVDISLWSVNMIYVHLPFDEFLENSFKKSEILACAMDKLNDKNFYNFLEDVYMDDGLSINWVYDLASEYWLDKNALQNCVSIWVWKSKVEDDITRLNYNSSNFWLKDNTPNWLQFWLPSVIIRNKTNGLYSVVKWFYDKDTYSNNINSLLD